MQHKSNEEMLINFSVDSLPGCLGLYGAPIVPNGPCKVCRLKDVCKRMLRRTKR
jgi:hypothetical protein